MSRDIHCKKCRHSEFPDYTWPCNKCKWNSECKYLFSYDYYDKQSSKNSNIHYTGKLNNTKKS